MDFELKKGKGTASNASNWYCAHVPQTDEYMAAVTFSGYQGTWLSFWYIDKAIWDKVGTFEDDDYKSEQLIKTGKLAFRSERDTHWSMPMPDKVVDPNYKEKFAWFHKGDDRFDISE